MKKSTKIMSMVKILRIETMIFEGNEAMNQYSASYGYNHRHVTFP